MAKNKPSAKRVKKNTQSFSISPENTFFMVNCHKNSKANKVIKILLAKEVLSAPHLIKESQKFNTKLSNTPPGATVQSA